MDLPGLIWIERRDAATAEPLLTGDLLMKATVVHSVGDATDALTANGLELVVIALGDRDAEAGEVAELVAAVAPSASVIALCPSDADVLTALAAGACDALPLGRAATELEARLHAAARTRQMLAGADQDRLRALELRMIELARENDRLRELAHSDELTGLANRRSFLSHVDYMLEYASRFGGSMSILMADLDGLKQLNDVYGHAAGDEALKRVARIFRASVRGVDIAARLGGDEFAVVMPATPGIAAGRVAERIRAAVAALALPGGVRVSASFGVATISGPPRGIGFAADELIARADAALYAAKRGGRNRVEVDGVEQVRAA